MSKLDRALRFVSQNPDASEKEVHRLGFSKSTLYKAKRILREEASGEKPGEPSPDPYVHLIQQMEEQLGLVELHYKDGMLEIIQRRKVKVH